MISCMKCQKPSRDGLCGRCNGAEKQKKAYKSPYKEAGINAISNNGTYPVKS